MGVSSLADAIILQSLEDLSDFRHRDESMEFFSGEGFRVCAKLAGMAGEDEMKTLGLASRISRIPVGRVEEKKAPVKAVRRSKVRQMVSV